MTCRLDIRPEAEADIRSAARWYETERMGLGVDFTEAVDAAIDSLSDNALLYTVKFRRCRRQVRWMLPHRFPYRIIYYVEGKTVKIFAVVHAKRHNRAGMERL